MGRVIYVYLDDDDLKEMQTMLSGKRIFFWNTDKKQIGDIQAFSHSYSGFYVGYDCESAVKFMPCFYAARYLQCATFRIENKDDTTTKKIFDIIKKYIHQTYFLSQDQSYYIGTGMYKGWIEKKYSVPMLFQYEECSFDENEVKKMFTEILANGYIIKENRARLRNIDKLDFSSESFVIFVERSNILSTIVNKNKIYYEYGSDCIFVYKDRHKKIYRFILDRRIIEDPLSNSPMLFEKIKNKQFANI